MCARTVWLLVLVDVQVDGGQCRHALGVLVEVLPGCTEENLERSIANLQAVKQRPGGLRQYIMQQQQKSLQSKVEQQDQEQDESQDKEQGLVGEDKKPASDCAAVRLILLHRLTNYHH